MTFRRPLPLLFPGRLMPLAASLIDIQRCAAVDITRNDDLVGGRAIITQIGVKRYFAIITSIITVNDQAIARCGAAAGNCPLICGLPLMVKSLFVSAVSPKLSVPSLLMLPLIVPSPPNIAPDATLTACRLSVAPMAPVSVSHSVPSSIAVVPL